MLMADMRSAIENAHLPWPPPHIPSIQHYYTDAFANPRPQPPGPALQMAPPPAMMMPPPPSGKQQYYELPAGLMRDVIRVWMPFDPLPASILVEVAMALNSRSRLIRPHPFPRVNLHS
jgi:hypothetical protein